MPPCYYWRVLDHLSTHGVGMGKGNGILHYHLSDLKAWHLVIMSSHEALFMATMKATVSKGKMPYPRRMGRFLLTVPAGTGHTNMILYRPE